MTLLYVMLGAVILLLLGIFLELRYLGDEMRSVQVNLARLVTQGWDRSDRAA